MNHLQRAIPHAKLGFRVIPLEPETKRPRVYSHDDATTNPQVVAKWWKSWPDSIPAVRTGSGLLLVDLDTKHEQHWGHLYGDKANGVESWKALFGEEHLQKAVRTRSGGLHLWFSVDRPFEYSIRTFNPIFERSWEWMPCIDIRYDGGYAALWDDIPIPTTPAPQRLLDTLAEEYNQRHSRKSSSPVVSESGNIPEGARNDFLFRFASSLRRFGVPQEQIMEGLAAQNERCTPPLSESELQTIVESVVARYTPKTPWQSDGECKLLMTLDELLALPRPDYLVEGIIPERSIGSLFGPSGSYKSFILLDLMLAVASGQNWQGHPVKQGPVVYIAGEGGLGIRKRVEAWMKVHPNADLKGRFFPVTATFKADQEAHVQTLLEDLTLADTRPAIIAVDTLSTALSGDENSQKDVQRFLDGLKRFVERGSSVVVVHHTGHETQERERGSSVFPANVDFRIKINKQADLKSKITCAKQKDDEPFAFNYLNLQKVVVGTDKYGQEVTSLAVTPSKRWGL